MRARASVTASALTASLRREIAADNCNSVAAQTDDAPALARKTSTRQQALLVASPMLFDRIGPEEAFDTSHSECDSALVTARHEADELRAALAESQRACAALQESQRAQLLAMRAAQQRALDMKHQVEQRLQLQRRASMPVGAPS